MTKVKTSVMAAAMVLKLKIIGGNGGVIHDDGDGDGGSGVGGGDVGGGVLGGGVVGVGVGGGGGGVDGGGGIDGGGGVVGANWWKSTHFKVAVAVAVVAVDMFYEFGPAAVVDL
jgi:hypothetical protein